LLKFKLKTDAEFIQSPNIKAAKVFKLDQESFVAAFAEILGHTIDLLNYCEEQFL